ncbi:AC9 transposase [Ceratobasidium sp. AG-Ba]|nr:AC9 transposase [Ceratobasidium sp. AG-Ba]
MSTPVFSNTNASISSDFIMVNIHEQAQTPDQVTLNDTSQIIEMAEVNVNAPTEKTVSEASGKVVPKKRTNKANAVTNKPEDVLAVRRKQLEARIVALESMVESVETPPPTLMPREVSSSRPLRSAARDVWYWVRPVTNDCTVQDADCGTEIEADAMYQELLSFESLKHPASPYLRCIQCLKTMHKTHIWANRSGGLTGAIRNHLEKYHPASYYLKCQEEGMMTRLADGSGDVQPEFTRPGFMDRLVDWAVTTDQPLNVVESLEFCDFILYCGQGGIKDNNIPHRDKLATAAWAMYLLEKARIDKEMKNARGRVSLTSDLWSDSNLRSFMAVTAHYINECGDLKDHLISFRKIEGRHTGENVANALFSVLQESSIAKQVNCITLDNASNNNTLMEELATYLAPLGAEFHPERNRIRCFPHIMNLAVNDMLSSLSDAAAEYRAEMSQWDLPIDSKTESYLQALESQPVDVVRAAVHDCRRSGLRREGLHDIIIDGNRLGRFRRPDGGAYTIRPLQLLRDVPTRWSSTYNMIERYLELHPAIAKLALQIRNDARITVASHKQYEVLQDILSVLWVAHNAQQLLSAEKTPTLALAFPVYEAVIEHWEQLCGVIPELSHLISSGISKLQEYVTRTQDVPVHLLSMFVNPSLKLDWIRDNWTPPQAAAAEAAVRDERVDASYPSPHHCGGPSTTHVKLQQPFDSSAKSWAFATRNSRCYASVHQNYPRLTTAAAQKFARQLLAPGIHSNHNSTPATQPNTDARDQMLVDEEFARYMEDKTVSTSNGVF